MIGMSSVCCGPLTTSQAGSIPPICTMEELDPGDDQQSSISARPDKAPIEAQDHDREVAGLQSASLPLLIIPLYLRFGLVGRQTRPR